MQSQILLSKIIINNKLLLPLTILPRKHVIYQQIKFFLYLNCIKLWERQMQDAIQIINLKLI